MRNGLADASLDILLSLKDYSLVGMLGWQDVRQRYRRSKLGAFWLTISMGIMIGTMGIIFGKIFNTPMSEFLPFLSVGMILWGFISSTISDGCLGFVSSQHIIKQLPIPLFVHIARVLWKNIIVFGHNFIIFPLVLLFFMQPPSLVTLLCIPGFLLFVVNLSWVTLILGILCARYRDLPQIITSVLQIIFYVTPIMWMPNKIPARAGTYLIDYNPFYHLLNVVRAPLLNQIPTVANWLISLGIAIFGWVITLMIYSRYKRRIAYWL